MLTQNQPRSTLCNKTVLGTVGYNADAAAAICNLVGQQLASLRQEQAQQKLSTLSHWLQ